MSLLPGWLTRAKKRSAAKSDENITVEGERSIKAAEKDPSAAVVAGVRSTGATVVLQRKCDWILAKANTVSLIFTTAQSQNGSCSSTEIHSSPWQLNDLL